MALSVREQAPTLLNAWENIYFQIEHTVVPSVEALFQRRAAATYKQKD